ncbi:hypothetical protein Ahy_B06g081969 isoform B [Arachis hypogaea]|uniref:Uncharacterized protein n=1 Tax=Arachis hypogaea TaxID=3818 RepID=A0A444YMF5_ARAHY|nr:hypothetical protein Ahy_B06g081969 isoform B [Arachis hypogaea]
MLSNRTTTVTAVRAAEMPCLDVANPLSEMQAIDQVARLLSGFLGSLGVDFQHFPINEDS